MHSDNTLVIIIILTAQSVSEPDIVKFPHSTAFLNPPLPMLMGHEKRKKWKDFKPLWNNFGCSNKLALRWRILRRPTDTTRDHDFTCSYRQSKQKNTTKTVNTYTDKPTCLNFYLFSGVSLGFLSHSSNGRVTSKIYLSTLKFTCPQFWIKETIRAQWIISGKLWDLKMKFLSFSLLAVKINHFLYFIYKSFNCSAKVLNMFSSFVLNKKNWQKIFQKLLHVCVGGWFPKSTHPHWF